MIALVVAEEFEPLQTIIHSLFAAGATRAFVAYDAAAAVRICRVYAERIDIIVGQFIEEGPAIEPIRMMSLNRPEVRLVIVADHDGVAAGWPLPVNRAQAEASAIMSAIRAALEIRPQAGSARQAQFA